MFRVLKCILTISFFIIPTDALFASSPQDIDSINTTFRELISNQDFDGAEAQCDLLEQLADGGGLIIPVGEQTQILKIITRQGDTYNEQQIEAVRFVPLIPGDLL